MGDLFKAPFEFHFKTNQVEAAFLTIMFGNDLLFRHCMGEDGLKQLNSRLIIFQCA